MALTTRFRGYADPFDDLIRSFNAITSPSLLPSAMSSSSMLTSRMDITDKKEHYAVRIELPGVHREDIKVQLDGNRLYVEAHKQEEKHGEDERMFYNERAYGTVRRTVEIPGSVDPNKIEAQFQDGVLYIDIGKHQGQEAQHLVPVK